jgi:type I restriction enzyme S subunit
MSNWPIVPLGDVIDFFDFRRIPLSSIERATRPGDFPYYGASGIIDWIDDYIFDGRYLLVAEDGENLNSRKLPVAFFAEGRFWVNNHAHIIRGKPGVLDDVFLQQWFAQADIGAYVTGAAQPKLSQASMKRIQFPLPPLAVQRKIAALLSAYDDLIENSTRRITILDTMAQRIYREWFVDFRYPGHETASLVDSELGPIPEGWCVRSVAELAGSSRYAVSSGPFGSKLGRSDYRAAGIPVIRGTNLAVGGGFRDRGFVFVSDEKADELASSIARPGDIVVTQRGTIGQVGVIPQPSRYPRYVLSQSQMKITVDPAAASAAYVFASIRSAEVTDRIQNSAMTAGVPHINLSMLRALPLVAPPLNLQRRFEHTMQPFDSLAHQLDLQLANLNATRDLLLPRLLSGQIDVTELDIEVPEAAA